MKAYFVRHGETNYNLMHLCNDNPRVDVHLTDTGRQQAREVAERLRYAKIELIVISEFPRTKQTAGIINVYHNAPFIVDGRINDRKTGFEGKPTREFQRALQASQDQYNARFGNGETFQEEKQRVSSFLEYLKAFSHDAILIVAHNEILKIANGIYHNLSDEQMANTPIYHGQVLEFIT